jgi:hypothetical protein
MIDITEGFTGIAVAPNEIQNAGAVAWAGMSHRERTSAHRADTGARVTLEFVRPTPIPTDHEVRVRYDIAENGELREFLGVPRLTHTTSPSGDCVRYHYRVSHWIPAPSVMQFVRA